MSKANTSHIVRLAARAALAAAKSDGTDAEKIMRIVNAIDPFADKLIIAGMDQTILAANARKLQLRQP